MLIKYKDENKLYHIEPLNLHSVYMGDEDGNEIKNSQVFSNRTWRNQYTIDFGGWSFLSSDDAKRFIDAIANASRYENIFDVEKWCEDNGFIEASCDIDF